MKRETIRVRGIICLAALVLIFALLASSCAGGQPAETTAEATSPEATVDGVATDAATEEDKVAFASLRNALDESLAGTRLAKDRAAKCLTTIMIPEALDYPM